MKKTIALLLLTATAAIAQTPSPTPPSTVKVAWDAPVDPFLYRVQPLTGGFQAQYKTPNISDFVALDTKIYTTQALAQSVIDAYKATGQITQFKLYEHSGAVYSNIATINAPTNNFTITNVTPGYHTYAVTSVASSGFESLTSNESTTGQVSPPTGMRIVSQTVTPLAKSARVSWQTSEPSKAKVVLYGAKPNNILQTQVDNKAATTHSVKFAGLKKGKTYSYQILVKTATGGPGPTGPITQFNL